MLLGLRRVVVLFRSFLGAAEVGWDTPKSSARVSSVWFWRRYNRVAFNPWVRMSLWGLVFGLFRVRLVMSMFSRAANCVVVRPGLR